MNQFVVILMIFWTAAVWGDMKLDMENAKELEAAGATISGDVSFVPGFEGNAAHFGRGGYLTLPAGQVFDAAEGSLDFYVRPQWAGSDGKRHSFFHLGGGQTHVTVFKTEMGTLRFVYKKDPSHFCAADLSVKDWKPGQWHRVTAAWLPLADELAIALKVDGVSKVATGARKLEALPDLAFIGSRGPHTEFAEADIDSLAFSHRSTIQLPFAAAGEGTVHAAINVTRALGDLRRVHDFTTIWNSRDVPLPFKKGDAYWRRFKDAQFRMARLVAFSDTWLWGVAVTRDEKEAIRLDFKDFDALVDVIRSAGAQVYLRLAYNMPRALSSSDQDRKWAYAPPKDYAEWDYLMRRIVEHCNVERKLNIKYFVTSLNEGDIAVRRGAADWKTICELYERTSRIVKEIDPAAKVGGPAPAADPSAHGEPFMREFLSYCRERKLPLDFVCFHAYRRFHPTDYERLILRVKELVAEGYPECNPEYFLDEFNLWRRDEKQDNEYGAAYIAASLHYQRRAGLRKCSIVSFNHFRPWGPQDTTVESHQGPFDKREGQAARFINTELEAGKQKKPCILAHPPGRGDYTFGAYKLDVPRDNPRMSFCTGLAIKLYPRMDGVTFEIVVKQGDREWKIFSVHQRELRWIHHEIALEQFARKEVTIEFRTNCGPGESNTIADWGAWGEPLLLTGPPEKPKTSFDFIKRIENAETGVRTPGFRYSAKTIAQYSGLPLIKGPVVTAPYFVFLMYSMLREKELAVELDGRGGILDDNSVGITASGGPGGVAILVWRFDIMHRGKRMFELDVKQLDKALAGAKRVRIKRSLIDSTHTNPYYNYVVAGKPDDRGRYNLESGRPAVVEELSLPLDANGGATLTFELEPKAVTLLELSPE